MENLQKIIHREDEFFLRDLQAERGPNLSIPGPAQGFIGNFCALVEIQNLGSIRAGTCLVIDGRNLQELGRISWREICAKFNNI